MPGRRVWRAAGRALGYLVRKFTPGWSTSSLHTAFDEVRRAAEQLQGPASDFPQCELCHASMAFPGMCVADAGQ
eukprot:8393626-Pyramimonas_sp.AAC.1